MSAKIPWDLYEAAILLEGYFSVENGKETKKQAITRISMQLRKMAEDNGIEVDETYRNENGIAMQYANLQYVITKGKHGLKCSSKVFETIYDIYENDKRRYKDVLRELINMDEKSSEIKLKSNRKDFGVWLINNKKLSEATSRSLQSGIQRSEEFAADHGLMAVKFYDIDDINVAIESANILLAEEEFIVFSRESHNRYAGAVKKYIEYLMDDNALVHENIEDVDRAIVEISTEDEEYVSNCRNILEKYYKKGFRRNSNLEMRRFKHFWNQEGFEKCVEENKINIIIDTITISINDMSYLPEMLLDKELEKSIIRYIEDTLQKNSDVIYFDAIYTEYKEALDDTRIQDSEMLRLFLISVLRKQYHFTKKYITKERGTEIDVKSELEKIFVYNNRAMSIDEIAQELSNFPKDYVISWLRKSPEFILNARCEYFGISMFELSDKERCAISSFIGHGIEEKGYVTGNEITRFISENYSRIVERNSFASELGIRNAVGYLLRNEYKQNGAVFCALDADLTMGEIVANIGNGKDSFTIADVEQLQADLDIKGYVDFIHVNSVRISYDFFVSPENISFDIDNTDKALDRYCTGEYLPIKDVEQFGSFPMCGYEWNEFLLESYLAKYSKQYRLLHGGYGLYKCAGAMVKRSSRIETFEELVIDVLSKSNVRLDSEDAIEFLKESGYISRKSFAGIENILIKANTARNKRG